MRLLPAISVVIALIALMFLSFLGGAIYSCEASEGVFLPNLECVNRSALDYCLLPDESVAYSMGMPTINRSWGFKE